MKDFNVVFQHTDLASRSSARIVRADIESHLIAAEHISINLSNVESISDSYADELFGIIALELGLDDFQKRITLRYGETHLYESIARNILNRLSSPLAA